MRELTFAKAILEATSQCMENDPSVYIMGLGVPDSGGIFGTTTGLQEKFSQKRVMDIPAAENGMTGIAIGSAIAGMRPILTHQRVDFALLSVEQLVNQAAKWHYTFNEQMNVPLVVRMIIGRGWGQGSQHSQSLHSWFGHIPGLKVIMPFSAHDAKGLLISAIEDNNPVIFMEHRWLHNLKDNVPEEMYRVPLGKARIINNGSDITLAGIGHTVYECLRAAQILKEQGISAEVIDLRSVRPLDEETVLASVRKTGHIVMVDDDWASCGLSAEILATVAEKGFSSLKSAPVRMTWPDHPLPTSPALSENFYTSAMEIALRVWNILRPNTEPNWQHISQKSKTPHDVPNLTFTGPF